VAGISKSKKSTKYSEDTSQKPIIMHKAAGIKIKLSNVLSLLEEFQLT